MMNSTRRLLLLRQPLAVSQPGLILQRATAVQHARLLSTTAKSRASSSSEPAEPVPFDTFRFTQRLQQQGFSPEQSTAIMECLSEVLDGSLRNMSRTVATRADQDKHIYTYKVDFTQLKSELQMLSRNDVEMMKNEHARLAGELEKLKQKLRDEVSRTQAGVRLDMNLDKGRMRDEQAALEIKVRESDARIENEIANLRTMMETIKFQILQYIIGTMTGAGALLLAYLRMFK